MARGTGLPIQETDATLQPTPGVNADAFSNAQSWAQIAQAGRQLRDDAVHSLRYETHKTQVGYLADREENIHRNGIDTRDQHQRDPAAFDAAWRGYTDGVLAQAEPWAVPHLRRVLGRVGNTHYGAILSEHRAEGRALDRDRVTTLAAQAGDEVLAAAASGALEGEAGLASMIRLRGILDTAVSSGFMTQDAADVRMQDIESRAGATSVVRLIGDAYRANRARGLEAGPAAMREAEQLLLRNDDPGLVGLSEQQRQAYYARATSEIRALEAVRRQDLLEVRREVRDIVSNAPQRGLPPRDVIDGLVEQLEAAGGHADAARLRAAMIRHERMGPFRRLPIAEAVQELQNTAMDMGIGFRPEVNEAIAQAAAIPAVQAAGITPDILRRMARIESGGNPNAASPSGTYRGLFQFGPAEWAQWGRGGDITNPAHNADAAARRLAAEAGEFQQRHGRAATALDLYMMHQQGQGGYDAHLANPNRPAWQNMASTAEGRSKGDAWARAAIWGNIPERERRRFPGGVDSVTSADFIGVWRRQMGAPAGDPRLVGDMRQDVGQRARSEWALIKADLDKPTPIEPNPAALQSVVQAAAIAGDDGLLEEMGIRLQHRAEAQEASGFPLPMQQNTVTALEQRGALGQLSPGQSALLRDMRRNIEAIEKGLKEDPVSLGVTQFPNRFSQPQPLDLANRDNAMVGMRERVTISAMVGQNYDRPGLSILSRADRGQIVAAINGQDPALRAGALDVLASIPDEHFAATLHQPDIANALKAAARTNDPALYTAIMPALDRMWNRAPREFANIMGPDALRNLQDWQGSMRYQSPDQLADALRRRDDPPTAERRRAVIQRASQLVGKKTVDDVLAELDQGLFHRRAAPPMEEQTRNAFMGEYRRLFTERYNATNDQTIANQQAIARMRITWSRSEVNGGSVMRHAPETVYQAVNGSHAWMRTQLLADLNAMGIDLNTMRSTTTDVSGPAVLPSGVQRPTGPTSSLTAEANQSGRLVPGFTALPGTSPAPTAPASTAIQDYRLIADAETDADINNGRPATYLIRVQNAHGEWNAVFSPSGNAVRYFWHTNERPITREEYIRQRREVLGITENMAPGPLDVGRIIGRPPGQRPQQNTLGGY
jgi:hypothetical protein